MASKLYRNKPEERRKVGRSRRRRIDELEEVIAKVGVIRWSYRVKERRRRREEWKPGCYACCRTGNFKYC